jgi:hypothetical protein
MRTRIDPKPILLAALRGEEIPPGRKMGVVYSRFIFTRYLRAQGKTTEDIAAYMGKDHATVSHYINKYTVEYEFNQEFRELADWFNQIKEQI